MFLIGGFKKDSLQESHQWHCQPIRPEEIDESLCVSVEGDDRSSCKNKLFPLPRFHMPIFGGWKNYVILEVEPNNSAWHVGWIFLQYPRGFSPRHSVHKKKIIENRIRVLKLPNGHHTMFFAISDSGTQLSIKIVGEGVLGDNRHADVHLY